MLNMIEDGNQWIIMQPLEFLLILIAVMLFTIFIVSVFIHGAKTAEKRIEYKESLTNTEFIKYQKFLDDLKR